MVQCSLLILERKENAVLVFPPIIFFSFLSSSLAFSLSLFLVEALIVIAVLLARRNKRIGGELGGPVGPKYATSAILIGLWVIYVTTSTLEAYGFIEGF